MNTSHTATLLAATCVAAAALTASAAWADGMEDTDAAVKANWLDNGEVVIIFIIYSDTTTEKYTISQSGHLRPADPPELWGKNNGPWGLGSTIVVVGDTVYRVTALHDGPPRVDDIGIRVGIVWEEGLPYALSFSHESGLNDVMWNITDGMSPVEQHPYGLGDAEWGRSPGTPTWT